MNECQSRRQGEGRAAQRRTLREEARLERLGPIRAFVRQNCAELALAERATFQLTLAVDEACTNVIEHGHVDEEGERLEPTELCLEVAAHAERLVITIIDHGRPFDPDAIAPPDLSADWRTRRVGGLGWHLIHEMTDAVYYTPQPSGNHLTLIKKLIKESSRAV